jgi:Gpi18-like mannosyltransferase
MASRTSYLILLSAGIQLAIGAFTAHPYDGRVFMASGYLVAHGNSPYVPTSVSEIFGRSLFPDPVPGIGYLPPWSLVLALSYLVSYNVIPNLILYNLAIKVPIVFGNILLALLVGKMIFGATSSTTKSENATRFMLFNPFVIYTTAIWGQFDTASVLLMLLAIFELTQNRRRLSAIALGGAIALKLIPVVLLPLLIFCERKRENWLRAFEYLALVAAVVGLSCLPFLISWSAKPIIDNWNIHFVRIGAFSPMNVLLLFGIASSANQLSFLGFLWAPSLALVYLLLIRKRAIRSTDLLLPSLAVMLGFSLTRSWVSEQNLNFVLPLVLLCSVEQHWSKKWVSTTWLLPLIFAVFHTFPLEMLFLTVPQSLIDHIQVQLQLFFTSEVGGAVRALITLVWLIVGLALLRKSVHKTDLLRSERITPQPFELPFVKATDPLTNLRT